MDVIKQQSNARPYVKALVKRLPQDGFSNTAEGVAIWLKALHLDVDVKMPKDIWQKKNPLHKTELSRLATALKDSSSTAKSTKDPKAFKDRGTWSTNVHFAWTEALDYLLTRHPQPEQEKIDEISFETFWAVVVDGTALVAPIFTC